MNASALIQDVFLYVVVVLGILLYKSVLFHQYRQAGNLTSAARKRQNRLFFGLFSILTALFIVGVLHQFGLLGGYISLSIAGLFAAVGLGVVGWIRKSMHTSK